MKKKKKTGFYQAGDQNVNLFSWYKIQSYLKNNITSTQSWLRLT